MEEKYMYMLGFAVGSIPYIYILYKVNFFKGRCIKKSNELEKICNLIPVDHHKMFRYHPKN